MAFLFNKQYFGSRQNLNLELTDQQLMLEIINNIAFNYVVFESVPLPLSSPASLPLAK